MAGIYIHIPFCRQACSYCDFHFSTSQRGKDAVLSAIAKELKVRASELQGEKVKTVYFGGGTPSLLSYDELMPFFELIYKFYAVEENPEISLEANPDDLSAAYLRDLRRSPVNRLSVGVQSFRDEDLQRLNRAHDSGQALRCIPDAAEEGFTNISIDLIFGLPGLGMEAWQQNVYTALDLPITHISCYGLTIEKKTALAWQIKKGITPMPDDEMAAMQYRWLLEEAEKAGFPWYEISNFAKPGFESKHNSSYWKGLPYLGIGPSAHSYTEGIRSFNVSSNALYVKEIEAGNLPSEKEELSHEARFHELLLTSLRRRDGLALAAVEDTYGGEVLQQLLEAARTFIDKGWLIHDKEQLRISTEGLLFADHITAELFVI